MDDRRSLYLSNPTVYNVAGLAPLLPGLAAPYLSPYMHRSAQAATDIHNALFKDFRVDLPALQASLARKAARYGAAIERTTEGSYYEPVSKKIYWGASEPASAIGHELGHHIDMTRKGIALGLAKRHLMKGLAIPIALDFAGLYAPMTTDERDATFGASLAALGGVMGARYQMERRANQYGSRMLNQALHGQGSPLRFNPDLFKGWIRTYSMALPVQAAAMSAGLGYFGYRAGQDLGLWGKPQ